MRTRAMIVLLALGSCLLGQQCNPYVYDITLTPEGDALRRVVVVTPPESNETEPATAPASGPAGEPASQQALRRKPGTLAGEELEALRKVYPAAPSQPPPGPVTFEGVFRGELPDDVGGKGYYRRAVTPMGSAWVYTERVRGNDDYAGRIKDLLAGSERTADLVIGWLGGELKDDPLSGKLKEFLDKDFRRDLQNAVLYTWTAGVYSRYGRDLAGDDVDWQPGLRLLQYFAERGYFSVQEAPSLYETARLALTRDDPDKLLGILQRCIATRMGVGANEPIPPSLAFLGRYDRAAASLSRYLHAQRDYRELAGLAPESQPASGPATQPADEPEPFGVLFSVTGKALPSSGGNPVTVRLATATQPFATNGKWDEKEGQVKWAFGVDNRAGASAIPQFCYALWSRPDEPFQKQHLGRVVLTGKELGQYCLWHAGLSQERGREWDGLLNSLAPGGGVLEKLEAFHFRGEPGTNEKGERAGSQADEVIGLIREGLAR